MYGFWLEAWPNEASFPRAASAARPSSEAENLSVSIAALLRSLPLLTFVPHMLPIFIPFVDIMDFEEEVLSLALLHKRI
jgi:hypothetical protein